MPEKLPTPEFSAEELELIEFLKTHLEIDAEMQSRMGSYIDQEGGRLREANAGARGTMESNLRLAKIYRAGGFAEAAWSALTDVRGGAEQAGDSEIIAMVDGILDQMDEAREVNPDDEMVSETVEERVERHKTIWEKPKE